MSKMLIIDSCLDCPNKYPNEGDEWDCIKICKNIGYGIIIPECCPLPDYKENKEC